jgi:predicted nicotinamide N-methyase
VRLAAFITAHTRLQATPFVPEVRLHLADDAIKLWERMEALAGAQCPPPFWAFPWAGGQALARYVLDNPASVAGTRVFDLGAGSGLVAIAAALAGADVITANDVDPYAAAAIELNSAANGVDVDIDIGDRLHGDDPAADVVLAGDVFYDRDLAERTRQFMARARARGAVVLVGDPGRAHLPRSGFVEFARYDVPVAPGLEDRNPKRTLVLRLQ